MKPPGGEEAIVEIAKIRDYILDPIHPRGRHKARVFFSVLGLGQGDAEYLRAALLSAANVENAVAGEVDEYGQRYSVDFELVVGDRRARIRSA